MDLYNAAKNGNIQECKRLLKYSKYKKVVNYGYVGACMGNHKHIVDYIQNRFLGNCNFNIKLGLYAAAASGNIKLFNKLRHGFHQLQYGLQNHDGLSMSELMRYAIRGGNKCIINHALALYYYDNSKVVEYLINVKDRQITRILLDFRKLTAIELMTIKIMQSDFAEATKLLDKYDSLTDLEYFCKFAGCRGSPALIDYFKARGIINFTGCLKCAFESQNFRLIEYLIPNFKLFRFDIFSLVKMKIFENVFFITQLIGSLVNMVNNNGGDGYCYFGFLTYIEICDALNFGLSPNFVLNFNAVDKKRNYRIHHTQLILKKFVYNDVVGEICKFIAFE